MHINADIASFQAQIAAMDSEQLLYLTEVAGNRSAAMIAIRAALGYSPSNLNGRQLLRLDNCIGQRLFDLRPRAVAEGRAWVF